MGDKGKVQQPKTKEKKQALKQHATKQTRTTDNEKKGKQQRVLIDFIKAAMRDGEELICLWGVQGLYFNENPFTV